MRSPTGTLRFVAVVALLLTTALFLYARSRPESVPTRQSVESFPVEIGEWHGRSVPIAPEVREILGHGEFAVRLYPVDGTLVDLFVAYFATQRTGSTIHSPKNCIPGSGWTPVESGHVQLQSPNGKPLTVNRYIVAKGMDRQLVLYWYQAHSRVVASEYWAKFYLTADAISMNRSDGALVRVLTPIGRGEDPAIATKRATQFAQTILPRLDSYIPQ